MKNRNTKLDRIPFYSKLVKEGFTLSTLLKFNDQQLLTLHSKIINEVETTQAQKNVYNLGIESDEEAFKAEVTDDTLKLAPENIDIEDKTATITTDIAEEEELTPANKPIVPVKKVSPDGQVSDQEILELSKNEFDMYETIMYGGAGDFDATSFYNPEAGGFDTSVGPADSYYSTDNKENLIGAGTDQDEGQYTGNAKYLDTPSFHNPDASGFDSGGPRDSYGQSGYDEGGFAGELNEYAREVDPEPPYHFKSAGPSGHSDGLHEDAEDELVHVQKDVAGMDTDQDAPQKGPDNDDNADDGMGMFETITKKELMEVAVSEKQFNFYQMVKACKESKYKDCGDGRNDQAVKKAAKDMTPKQIKDYTDTPNPNKLPKSAPKTESINREIIESWLIGLVEKYERPSMSKEQLLQSINEIAVGDAPAPVKTPTRIKPGTRPGRPDRKSPYQPKHKPRPKAEDADNDIEDAKHELPSWLDFDSLFTNHEENE